MGLNLTPDEVRAFDRRHKQGVWEAEGRFRAWGEWRLISGRDTRRRVYRNSEYVVMVAEVDTHSEYFGLVTYLMIGRQDGEAVYSWLDLQHIKNSLVGEEALALEVFPPESHLLDTANVYHLWVLPEGCDHFPLDLMTLHRRWAAEQRHAAQAVQQEPWKTERQRRCADVG